MQRSSAPGPSRRWSPANLDRTMFDADAEQSLASQYDYSRTSTTTATTNAYHPYITQPEYPNYTQTAESSLYTHAASISSSYQYAEGLYPANNQQGLQAGVSYQSAPADLSSSAHYDHSTQPSVSYSPNSAYPHAAGARSSGSSQRAPKLQPSKKWTTASQSTPSASYTRPGDDASYHKASMASMMGRARLPIGGNAHIEAVPQSSGIGDKRKDRASSPSDTTHTAEASPVKKKKEALRVKDHRKNRTEATAELAKRLPSHLQVYEAPSVKHIRKAIVHIDEQSAHIGRLESENAQCRAAQAQLMSRIFDLQNQIQTLREEKISDGQHLAEKDTRIRGLERELQRWQYQFRHA